MLENGDTILEGSGLAIKENMGMFAATAKPRKELPSSKQNYTAAQLPNVHSHQLGSQSDAFINAAVINSRRNRQGMGGRPLHSRNNEDALQPAIIQQKPAMIGHQAIDIRSESILEFYQNSAAGNESTGRDGGSNDQYAFQSQFPTGTQVISYQEY